ncbi:hypothetical protein BD779DRAFT_403895 [Infundibulicybe gibba]|nr:hypothetical protein BD779DRAFT_403895 [Infundibulicybe gibba]
MIGPIRRPGFPLVLILQVFGSFGTDRAFRSSRCTIIAVTRLFVFLISGPTVNLAAVWCLSFCSLAITALRGPASISRSSTGCPVSSSVIHGSLSDPHQRGGFCHGAEFSVIILITALTLTTGPYFTPTNLLTIQFPSFLVRAQTCVMLIGKFLFRASCVPSPHHCDPASESAKQAYPSPDLIGRDIPTSTIFPSHVGLV